ncbi:TIGR03086 family metal-binding protein [Kitasatospora sp. CM 4170]|uniref:TIGR03086 family metal-binding protein n=1 Tax=Kitasatospora aburaviensis TaxID=67265 RepID=A0ABW1EUM0_9ACTN|nr:TIGR03086 family metal-binding protein [Kitasatospora sp. CM 4170]WNM45067.1 TIGR03086 family metal-binding protein [Kitasatospora sp. CM 4170]
MAHRRENRPSAQPGTPYAEALHEFGERVRLIAPDQWDAPTPCVDWSVRDLVNHLTSEQLWVPELLMGSTISEVGSRFDGDVLGSDPVGAWTAAAEAARTAFEVPGASELTVHLSFADVSGQYYLDQLTADAVVHTWDLAEGIGNRTRLPAGLVEYALGEYAGYGDLSGSGLFDPPVPVPEDAGPQTRLLALTGRRDRP